MSSMGENGLAHFEGRSESASILCRKRRKYKSPFITLAVYSVLIVLQLLYWSNLKSVSNSQNWFSGISVYGAN